jgi:branched-chain amino acid transport system substrate-binding protein
MQRRHGRRVLTGTAAMAATIVAVGTLWVAGGTGVAGAATSNSAPGVTSSKITLGAVGVQSGPIAGTFDGFVPGMRAYFDMVNAQGGVNGRKISLPTTLYKNTGGTASSFTSLAKQLVEQDHVFAMAVSTFVASAPGFLAQSGTPTYGFNTNGTWTGPPNLFAYSGSVLFYTALGPEAGYLMKQTHTNKAGFLAYNVTGSKPACTAEAKAMKKLGVTVAFENLSASIGSTYSSTVQRMKSAGVNFIVSCMQDTDNVSLARSIQQYGLDAKQLWLTGGGQALIDKYPTLMTGVYMSMTSVPFAAQTQYYPGLQKYLSSMKRYAPSYVNTQNAVRGWVSASTFVAGVRGAGADLTQAKVIAATNKLSKFTATGFTTITKWTSAHTKSVGPWCTGFVRVENKKMTPVFNTGHQVFRCFNLHSTNPVTPTTGTPGTT